MSVDRPLYIDMNECARPRRSASPGGAPSFSVGRGVQAVVTAGRPGRRRRAIGYHGFSSRKGGRMTIVQRMRQELRESMKARDAVRTSVLRYWIAQLTLGDG